MSQLQSMAMKTENEDISAIRENKKDKTLAGKKRKFSGKRKTCSQNTVENSTN